MQSLILFYKVYLVNELNKESGYRYIFVMFNDSVINLKYWPHKTVLPSNLESRYMYFDVHYIYNVGLDQYRTLQYKWCHFTNYMPGA